MRTIQFTKLKMSEMLRYNIIMYCAYNTNDETIDF